MQEPLRFAVKLKKDQEAINKISHRGHLDSGSFRRWYKEDSPDKESGKNYVLCLVRSYT